MPEFDPPLRSLLQILHFAFISFLLFSKIISILSKKFHIFELSFLLNDVHGLEGCTCTIHIKIINKILY